MQACGDSIEFILMSGSGSTDHHWLMKAVREGIGEMFGLFQGVDEEGLRWRPAPGEWCLKELAAHMRDADALYLQQFELITSQHEPLLPHEPLDVLPAERDYVNESLYSLLDELETLRQENFWILRMLSDYEWERGGLHPYKGHTTLTDLVKDMHEHDLNHLNQARKLRQTLDVIRPRRRR